MVRVTREEAIETRNRIIDAAEEVFYVRGLARTSLADVAVAAGVTRGAIYWHFKNKADLFEAMTERVRLPLETLMNASRAQYASDPLGYLRNTWIHLLQEAAQNERKRRVLDILFLKNELVDRNDPVWIRRHACYRNGLDNMERIFRDAIAFEQLPVDFDARLAAVMLHGQVFGLLMDWLYCPDMFDLAAIAERAVDTCMDGLRTSSALRLKIREGAKRQAGQTHSRRPKRVDVFSAA